MSNKYRIYCTTDSIWENVWTDDTVSTGITECPTNIAHSVNLNSVHLEQTQSKSFHINGYKHIKTKELSTSIYKDMITFLFEGSDTLGRFIHFKIIGSMNEHSQGKKGDSNFDYTVRIYDKTNRNIICTHTISGDPLEGTIKCTTGSNIPTGEAIFAVQLLLGSKGGSINLNYVELLFKT